MPMLSVFNMIETQVVARLVFASQGFKMLVLHVIINTATSSRHVLSLFCFAWDECNFRIIGAPHPRLQEDCSVHVKKRKQKNILSGLTFSFLSLRYFLELKER